MKVENRPAEIAIAAICAPAKRGLRNMPSGTIGAREVASMAMKALSRPTADASAATTWPAPQPSSAALSRP